MTIGLSIAAITLVQRNEEREGAGPLTVSRLDSGGAFEIGGRLFPGEVFAINFFASWCGPCREEHPVLLEVARHSHTPLVGVSVMDVPDNTEDYLAENGNPYDLVGIDPSRRASIQLGIVGPPYTLVFDRDGKIVKAHAGPIGPEFVDYLATLANRPVAARAR